jgi:membrane-associated protease RseP (regulator of RpoE activity)
MTGPKHLWSGDWETESAQTADDLASAPRPVFDTEPEPEPESRTSAARRWSRRQIAIALTTGIAAAAIAVAAVTAFDGSGGTHKPKAHKPAASAPASPTPGPTGGSSPITACQQIPSGCGQTPAGVNSPTANWLGMQIISSPVGVVISTVRLGSLADKAGFEPGDEIEQIDGHHVDNMDQVRQATAGIAIGKPVSIEVLRSSVMVTAASMAMTQRPTIHP